MEQRLTILGLGVADLKIASSFYEKQFGWIKMPNSNENITFFQLNGILLSLYPKDKLAEDAGVSPIGDGFKGFSIAFNTRSKEEVDLLELKGVTIVKHPEEVFWGGYSSYISDPDSNLWEIAYNPYLELSSEGNTIQKL